MDDFASIQDAYRDARKKQRGAIREFLQDAGFSVVKRGKAGQGKDKYTAVKHISSYDLSDWLWVEIKEFPDELKNALAQLENTTFLIDLQALDYDPENYHDVHVLYDRIAFVALVGKLGRYQVWHTTDLDLPLDESKKEKLLEEFKAFVNDVARMKENGMLPKDQEKGVTALDLEWHCIPDDDDRGKYYLIKRG